MWAIVAGIVLPMAFFAVSLTISLGLGVEKALEAATTGQMAIIFAKTFGIGAGLAFITWALLRVFWRKAAKVANPWPQHPEALVALTLLGPLLLLVAPFVIWGFVSATHPRSTRLNPAEWITFGLMLIVVLQGAILVTRNVRRTMREANDPCLGPEPELPMPPRRQLDPSLPVRKWWHRALVAVLLAIVIVIPLHAWVLQAFVIPVKSLEPELPAGSRVLVWKLTRQFAPGDIIAHKHGDKVWVSRVVREEKEQLVLQRNQWPEEKLPRADVIGKVVSVLWRPTPGAASPKTSGSSLEPEQLKELSWHQFDQTPGKYWRELSDDRRFDEAAKLIELYLSLHPELEEGMQRVNGGNLHFHAGQCWAFANDYDSALKHLSASKHDAPIGDLLWNDYVAGTAAFLRGDRPALLASREKLLAKGGAINQPNLAVLDRLIAHFGEPYFDAYNSGQRESIEKSRQPEAPGISNHSGADETPTNSLTNPASAKGIARKGVAGVTTADQQAVPESPKRITEPLALFAPVIDPSLSDASYPLVSTLVKPRHVVLAEVALVDDRISTAHTIPQLGFCLASADGTTNASARVTWSIESVTEGEGAWLVRVSGEGGGSKLERTARLGSRNRGFADIILAPGQPEIPDRGAQTALDAATTTWVAVRPERSCWVGPGEWSAGEWNSLTLFEARDDKGKVQRRLRLRLLVRPMLADAKVPWSGTRLRNGDWEKDQELRVLIGGPPVDQPKSETPSVVPPPKPALRGEVPKAGTPAEPSKLAPETKPPLTEKAYARVGVPTATLAPPITNWSAEQNGLRLGMRVLNTAGWRIGGQVGVEMWVANTGAQEVKFGHSGRTDAGLSVIARDNGGKDYRAEITQYDSYLHYFPWLLPPSHSVKVKEFNVRFDPPGKPGEHGRDAVFQLAPGDYKLHFVWTTPRWPNAPTTDWAGKLTSSDVEVKLLSAATSANSESGLPERPKQAATKLHRREVTQKNPDGKALAMTFEELRRDEKTSTATVRRIVKDQP